MPPYKFTVFTNPAAMSLRVMLSLRFPIEQYATILAFFDTLFTLEKSNFSYPTGIAR